ncbi:MAG: CDP-alcohol phosphatidyltransferase, partial [Paludibacteraceae bacterium]|nr:CDP-alcohol phosphatidyltransferase [Paludibacteraceae bacterium]
GFIVYAPSYWKIIGFLFVVLYGWEMITALLRYKITEQYSIDSGSFGPTEVRILISLMLILEVIVKDSILYTSSLACLVLLIMNFLETGKILKSANERDKKEKEAKIAR